jgi:hypothetical protein
MSGAAAYAVGRGGTWFCAWTMPAESSTTIRRLQIPRFRFTENLLQKMSVFPARRLNTNRLAAA